MTCPALVSGAAPETLAEGDTLSTADETLDDLTTYSNARWETYKIRVDLT